MNKPGHRPFEFSRKSKTNWGMLYFDPETRVVAELRIADLINWLNKRSQENQTKYKVMKGSTYLIAGLIALSPVLHNITPIGYFATSLIAVMGVAVIFIERLLTMNDCRGNWLSYRQTCEELKHEKFLYLSKAGPYASTDYPEKLLAVRTEKIVFEARRQWLEIRMGEEQFNHKIGSSVDMPPEAGQGPEKDPA